MDTETAIKYFEDHRPFNGEPYYKCLMLLLNTARKTLKPVDVDRIARHEESIDFINKFDAEEIEKYKAKEGTDPLSNPSYLKYKEALDTLIAVTRQAIDKKLIAPDLHRMKLHVCVQFDDISILRVPGGWIYMRENSSTFVPFNLEFSPHLATDR